MDPRVDTDSLSASEDSEGIILMEYMDKLAIVEVSDGSVDDFFNCEVSNDRINDATDVIGGDKVVDVIEEHDSVVPMMISMI